LVAPSLTVLIGVSHFSLRNVNNLIFEMRRAAASISFAFSALRRERLYLNILLLNAATISPTFAALHGGKGRDYFTNNFFFDARDQIRSTTASLILCSEDVSGP